MMPTPLIRRALKIRISILWLNTASNVCRYIKNKYPINHYFHTISWNTTTPKSLHSGLICVKNDVCGHEWGDSPINFTSDGVTSENYWRITTKTTNIVINGSPYIIFFSYVIFGGWNTDESMKTLIDRSSFHCCGIVTSRKHLLWRHLGRLSWERFQVRHVRLPVVKLIITRELSRIIHWLACKNVSLLIRAVCMVQKKHGTKYMMRKTQCCGIFWILSHIRFLFYILST